ncbi:unnamed protein product [Urochloa humidicola]
MAMSSDEDSGDKSTTFRCLDAVRYTVATVVTLLIVTVIVVSIKVVLRPESLQLSVVGGAVSSTPLPGGANAAEVILDVKLRAENPSGRAHMYFFSITAYLFDNKTQASTPTPDKDCFIMLQPSPDGDFAVAQQMGMISAWYVEGKNDSNVMDLSYFDMLYRERRTISDVTMRVDGSLVTEVSSMINRTHLATYYCWPLVVVGNPADDEAAKDRKDVPCVVRVAV